MVKSKALTAAFMAAVSFKVFAQVEVVELDVPSTRNAPADSRATYGIDAKPSPASMTEFYFQLQSLQQEVQTLRGIVEEQSYELKKLKQQRLDDYLDLDRRLSQITQSGSGSPGSRTTPKTDYSPSTAVVETSTAIATLESATPEGEDELSLYRSGIDAVLKAKDYDKALEIFNEYIQRFPQGIYAANAKYWLGQIYLRREDYASAEQWFRDLIANHPAHQKTPEAQFKLGKVLHLEGKDEEAKAQLRKVVASESSAAKLAQDYLNSNF